MVQARRRRLSQLSAATNSLWSRPGQLVLIAEFFSGDIPAAAARDADDGAERAA